MKKVRLTSTIVPMLTSCTTVEFTKRIPAVERTQFIDHGDNWRNLRYGEVIPVWKKGTKLYMEIYNTVYSNELPQKLWEKLDAKAMAEEYGAEKVLLNGEKEGGRSLKV